MAQSFYCSLSQQGRFRHDGQSDLNREIISDFKLNLRFYNNYDSKPPASAAGTFDFWIIFGVSYKFQQYITVQFSEQAEDLQLKIK